MSSHTASIPITIRGRYLWRGDKRFFVRGVAYQVPDMQDPISSARLPQLKLDITLFKELGLNTLFVYWVDDTKRHDQAMKLLEEAGIYVFTTVCTQFSAISRLNPLNSYHPTAMAEFFRTVDVMSKYPNTLGLLAANETVNDKDSEKAIPVVKAVVRDLKRYMGMKHEVSGQRVIPIGYNAATNDGRDKAILDYLSLGGAASTIDFWTCKGFMWAGNSSMEISGYSMLVVQIQNAAISIFMSEYGTNLYQPRMFQETAALYSPQMSQVFSGGCAYEFWQSSNGYGLVELHDEEGAPIMPGSISLAKNQKTRARKNGMSKTAEKRETDQGTLFIFQDFVNYKANLEATRGIERNWEGDIMEREAWGRANVDTAQRSWPWGPEFGVPESCVDWARLEELLRGEGLLYVM